MDGRKKTPDQWSDALSVPGFGSPALFCQVALTVSPVWGDEGSPSYLFARLKALDEIAIIIIQQAIFGPRKHKRKAAAFARLT